MYYLYVFYTFYNIYACFITCKNHSLFYIFFSFYWFYFWSCVFRTLYCWQYFLTTHFKHFDFIEWFDLNSNFSNLFETSSIKDFLLNFLMSLYILFISLKMLKIFSSGLILINTQLSSFSSAFYLSISSLRFLSASPNSSTSIASLC